ncbi:MAG: (Fe-S)-binding protein, partial [Bacillota bacterium]
CSLASPVMMGVGTAALGLLQRVRLDGLLGSLAGFPSVKAALRAAPRIPAVPYRRRHLPAEKGAGPSVRVAYFAGCFMNWVYADVAEATHRVLVHNGYRVESPPVACCGMPHRALGDLGTARRLARRNVDLLAGYAAVVTDCASCGAALKAYGEILAGDPEYAGRAKVLASRVFDISEFLVSYGYRRPEWPIPLRVTYHDPCHLGREQGVREQPRQILRSIPGLELVEMKDADMCCGGGGSFALTHPELAHRVGQQKAASIAAMEAEAVVSGCPSCLSQLRAMLGGSRATTTVCHPVQLLVCSYGQGAANLAIPH